ncbi:amino acid adenylation domain-containing protein [Bradyrhizobium sp. SZCCHNR2035]|uniref:non-ribosomal peptide synthetase n=1 Tax=Bradyrhizobium sp. SZCCHNR2035 TaxID=3057386 RepID=UPI002915F0A0|nr:amino acid adenylation domain-containing protein [Bradyrhizobium sp. SZCCHNR2035]
MRVVLQALLAGLLTRLGVGTDIPLSEAVAQLTNEGLCEPTVILEPRFLVADTSGDPSFLDVLNRINRSRSSEATRRTLSLPQNTDTFGAPLRGFEPGSDPILLLLWRNALGGSLAFEQVMGSTSALTRQFDLCFHFADNGGANDSPNDLFGAIEYSTDLFHLETATSCSRYLANLANAVARNADVTLSEIPLLGGTEVASAARPSGILGIDTGFETFESSETEQSIVARFEAQVARSPTRIAVQAGDTTYSYDEINCWANGIAAHLLGSIGAGSDRVALVQQQSPMMIATILGVLKAGKTYVPLDPNHPASRLEQIVQDSSAAAVISARALLEIASACAGTAHVIVSDDVSRLRETPPSARSKDAITYIIYTSGTTGRPKGVFQNDRNVLHYISVYTNNLRISKRDRITLLASYAFDAAVMDTYGALLNGATLILRDISDGDLRNFARWTREMAITIWHSTPSVFRHVVTQSDTAFAKTIRLVVLGGEETSLSDLDLLRSHFPDGCLLVNGFGPTEATIATQFIVDPHTLVPGTRVPIGYAVDKTKVHLLGPRGNVTEISGEIAIESEHLALGYWNDPAGTERAFVRSSDQSGRRIYRTGDLARQRRDGALEFLGRVDHQVKIRGYRIEPTEVELTLCRYPGVLQARVVTREGRAHQKQLVAYVVAAHTESLTPRDLRRHVSTFLPSYMVPAAIVMLSALPLTVNGKLDFVRLPAPDYRESVAEVTADHSNEHEMLKIWRDVLGLERVSATDNFFELGGDSLQAAALLNRLERTFGVAMPMHIVFEAANAGVLIKWIAEEQRRIGMSNGLSDGMDTAENAWIDEAL